MIKRWTGVLVSGAWMAATAALAQTSAANPPAPADTPPVATTVAPVTVEGTRAPATVQKQARSFVQSYAAPTAKMDQYARWRDPLCVQVVGLIPAQAAQVAARVEDVAKAVGLKVRAPACAANVEIVFTAQPQRLLDAVAQRREQALGFHYPIQTKALKTVTRPIQAWYVTATVGGGGNNAGAMFGGVPMQVHEEVVDDPENPGPTGCGDSHFSACLMSVFKNVLVVADSGRLQGKTLGLVADYVALLALSQPRSLDGCAVLPSVIDLLAPACPGREPPDGLTPADAAYLTALYTADLEAKKAGEQTDIANQMMSILTKAPR